MEKGLLQQIGDSWSASSLMTCGKLKWIQAAYQHFCIYIEYLLLKVLFIVLFTVLTVIYPYYSTTVVSSYWSITTGQTCSFLYCQTQIWSNWLILCHTNIIRRDWFHYFCDFYRQFLICNIFLRSNDTDKSALDVEHRKRGAVCFLCFMGTNFLIITCGDHPFHMP